MSKTTQTIALINHARDCAKAFALDVEQSRRAGSRRPEYDAKRHKGNAYAALIEAGLAPQEAVSLFNQMLRDIGCRTKTIDLQDLRHHIYEAKDHVFKAQDIADAIDHKELDKRLLNARECLEAVDRCITALEGTK